MEFSWETLLIAVVCGFIVLVSIFLVGTRNFNYFKKSGLPNVQPVPFLGSIMDFLNKPGHEEEQRRYNKYGRTYGFFEGNTPNLSTGDPEYFLEIFRLKFDVFDGRRHLITGDIVVDNMMALKRGDDWIRIRKIIQPAFSKKNLKTMMGIFKNCSNTMISNFLVAGESGKPVDMKRIFGAFTMDVIAQSAFSTQIDSHNDPDNQFVLLAKRVLNMKMSFKFICFHMLPTRLMRLFKISITDIEATHALKECALKILKRRRESGEVYNDFLQFLIKAVEAEEDERLGSSNADKDGKTQRRISMDELASQCVAFFLAGFDTTATTLSFAAYLLALNPSAQDKLRNEVHDILARYDGELTFEALQSMTYMDNVLSETLRLFPPIYRLERQANADCQLGDKGIIVRKGMLITIPIYALNRDPKYWPDPETFNPDRFELRREYPYFLPFGAGRKECAGSLLARVEIKVCLAYMLANFEILTSPKTKVPVEFDKGLNGLLQPLDITLQLQIRKNQPLIK